MKGEDIYNGITEIREDLVEEAGSAAKKRRPMKKRALGAVAAVLAAVLVAGYFLWPGSSPAVTEGYAICEAEYPEMAPYPDESALYTLDPDDEAAYEAAYAEFEAQYDAWWDDVYARRNLDNHAAGLADYLTSGAAQFLSGAEGENRALSPVNVYMALAMLAELTEGESRAQLLELLGAEDIEALRETAGDIWNAAYRDDGAITSVLASSVWLREDMDYNQETMEALAEYYCASSYRGEMGSEEYDEAYRAWLNEQTGGLLEDAVAESGFDAMPWLSAVLSDPLYAAICAGVLEGVGLGLVIRAGGSSGGSDVIPIILNRKFRLPIAPVLYAVDFTIIALQLPASDLESVVRSAIYAALYTVVMDRVILLGRGSVQISVVSDKFDEINRRLHALDHGTTLVTARTGLLKRECSVVMCVTHIRYLNEAKRVALDVDPGAFITVSSVRDVSGRGFTLGVERLPLDPPAE